MRPLKYIQQTLVDKNGVIRSNRKILKDFNTPISAMNRLSTIICYQISLSRRNGQIHRHTCLSRLNYKSKHSKPEQMDNIK
jgi:hypothetical protein